MRVAVAVVVCAVAILFAAHSREGRGTRFNVAGMPSVFLAAWLLWLRVECGLDLSWHEVLAPLYALGLVTVGFLYLGAFPWTGTVRWRGP